MYKKKLLSFVLLGVCSLVLSACSSSTDSKKIHHQVLLQLKLLKVLIPLQWRRSQKIVIKMGH